MTKINQFVLLSVINRAGQACGEYAFLWLGLALLGAQATTGSGDRVLTLNYAGQALGALAIAPYLAHLFDQSQKRRFSLLLATAYMMTLILAAWIYSLGYLSLPIIFIATATMMGLSIAQSSAISMYALKTFGTQLNRSHIGMRFALIVSVSYLIGASISGAIFEKFGFVGCCLVAAATFFPILVFYKMNFSQESVQKDPLKPSFFYFRVVKSSIKALRATPTLLRFMLMLSVLNGFAAIMPLIASLGVKQHVTDRADLYGLVIGAGIFIAVLSTPLVRRTIVKLPLSKVIPIFFLPFLVSVALMYIYPNIPTIILMFALNCIASAAVNIVSGGLRVALIPENQLGQINTFIMMLLFSGQLIGALFLVPIAADNLQFSLAIVSIMVVLVASLSLIFLPNKTIEDCQC